MLLILQPCWPGRVTRMWVISRRCRGVATSAHRSRLPTCAASSMTSSTILIGSSMPDHFRPIAASVLDPLVLLNKVRWLSVVIFELWLYFYVLINLFRRFLDFELPEQAPVVSQSDCVTLTQYCNQILPHLQVQLHQDVWTDPLLLFRHQRARYRPLEAQWRCLNQFL